ncbi:hypothetical protein [Candidatus Entotheonella palauensis]|uniref:hypothetical protein n=1 Tax=Candidatus Entotheonella palauensis TaxID=93172 RepID=UPI000B7E75AC|nr:hypothetical protein [Candidatus Entotheonella palauensis]
MCGHIFMGNMGLQPLRQHQPLWRCSACGRQSHMPLDCCAQPAYDDARPIPIIVASVRWLQHLLSGIQVRIRSWRMRSPAFEVGAVVAQRDLTPTLVDEVLELPEVLAPDIEADTSYDDFVEEVSDRIHELQVS